MSDRGSSGWGKVWMVRLTSLSSPERLLLGRWESLQYLMLRSSNWPRLVVIKFQTNQVWQTGQGVRLHGLDLVPAQVDSVQRVDQLDGFGYLVDFVLEEVEILYVGTIDKGLLVNCGNRVVF